MNFLDLFKNAGVDLIVFPECALSGFSSKMKESTPELSRPFLAEIQSWSNENNVQIVLPTAIFENNKIFNSGFIFNKNLKMQFYKIGLTDSEKSFFSVPENLLTKNFDINGFKYGLLICKEAQENPWAYVDDSIDFIIWPGYWGWTTDFNWSEKDNQVFTNCSKWQRPLIQANFSGNDLGQRTGAGPEGLSIIVDSSNKIYFQAQHKMTSGYIVNIEKNNNSIAIIGCRNVG